MATATQLQNEFVRMVSDPMFGEDVIYVAGGVEYEIRGHVYRKGIDVKRKRQDRRIESFPSKYDYEIRISSDATYGRSSVTVKEDKIKIYRELGGALITMRVMEIIEQDPGTWRLGLSV